ncbi:hypothetical protein OE88DRAFT_1753626 [Heliocybe sulcata]|uniref:Uncharacterized protein n=1 Tax=Heliocybe sulcata TaxID=5364 RepID=A0A5C3MXD8_9AGAM|nr:hypothetical protein OE88DRAFT_1753626 [Heliocybe sulcata]
MPAEDDPIKRRNIEITTTLTGHHWNKKTALPGSQSGSAQGSMEDVSSSSLNRADALFLPEKGRLKRCQKKLPAVEDVGYSRPSARLPVHEPMHILGSGFELPKRGAVVISAFISCWEHRAGRGQYDRDGRFRYGNLERSRGRSSHRIQLDFNRQTPAGERFLSERGRTEGEDTRRVPKATQYNPSEGPFLEKLLKGIQNEQVRVRSPTLESTETDRMPNRMGLSRTLSKAGRNMFHDSQSIIIAIFSGVGPEGTWE